MYFKDHALKHLTIYFKISSFNTGVKTIEKTCSSQQQQLQRERMKTSPEVAVAAAKL
jgi:hypothetical protein